MNWIWTGIDNKPCACTVCALQNLHALMDQMDDIFINYFYKIICVKVKSQQIETEKRTYTKTFSISNSNIISFYCPVYI